MFVLQATSGTTLSPGLPTSLAVVIFVLPYFLFSALAGQLADKYNKAKMARLVKALEIPIIGVAVLCFFVHYVSVLLVALFLLGLQSTLFGPLKYAILPQHLREDDLVGGNALVLASTFVAILSGMAAGAKPST